MLSAAKRRTRPAVSEMAERAIRQARGRGYESSDSILKYVHATFLLGADLETTPELAWAREIMEAGPEALEDAILDRLEVLGRDR